MKPLEIKDVQALLLELMKDVHSFLEKNQLKYYLLGGSALGAIRHNGFIPWDDDIDIGMCRDDYERFLELSHEFNNKYEVVNFQRANNCDFALTRIYIPDTYIDNPSISKTKLDKRLYFDIFPLDNVPSDKTELSKYEKQSVKFKKRIQRIDVRYNDDSALKLLIKKNISLLLCPLRNRILSSFDTLLKKYRNCETVHICSLCSQYSFERQVMPKPVYGNPILHKFEDAEFYIPEKPEEYLTTLFGEDYMQVPPLEKRRSGYKIYLTNEE